jgi:hypothetical protein
LLRHLGQGFLQERRNHALRAALRDGTLPLQEYYRELLRVIYRMLFMFIAEDKDLLFARTTPEQARSRYRRFYSMDRLRRLAGRRPGARHLDLWRGLALVWDRVNTETGYPQLGLPPLNGFLWSPAATAHLDGADLANVDLLDAVRALAFTRQDDVRRPVDFRNMGPEELGSVYESLLELQPEINADAGAFRLLETGTERRATGSHYTPTPILKRVLDFAVTPQIERCMKAPDPAAALLELRILDPACGSGHFLIAAAHRIARPLASVRTGELEPSPEHVHAALRDVVARCLYGVDYNPMAVELCKVALWIETFEPGKPLSFLDHHIQCGNSLIGVPLGTTVARNRAAVDGRRAELRAEIEQAKEKALKLGEISAAEASGERLKELRKELVNTTYDSWADAIPDDAFKAVGDDDRDVAKKAVAANKKARKTQQMEIGFGPVEVSLPPELVAQLDAIGAGAESTVAEVTVRATRYEEAIRHLAYLHALELADTWTAAWFWPLRPGAPPAPTQGYFMTLQAQAGSLPEPMSALVQRETRTRRIFHYELAFPEVFTAARGGFDLVLGNPPYLGGMRISGAYGDKVLHFLKGQSPEARGRTDLAAYFVRRGFDLLRAGGDLSLITTNSINEGDTLAAGLGTVAAWGGSIVNAVRSEPWEGEAAVSVSILHLHSGAWSGPCTLDGQLCEYIEPSLSTAGGGTGKRLTENQAVMFKGVNPLGRGFRISASEAAGMIDRQPAAQDVLFPLVGADELTGDPAFENLDWFFNFGERTAEEARLYAEPFARVEHLVKPTREAVDARGRFRVKSPRQREQWWLYVARAVELTRRLAGQQRVIAIPEVSKVMLPVMAPGNAVFLQTVFVIPSADWHLFGLLSSAFHWLWAAMPGHASSLETRPRYHGRRCFETFPRIPADAEVAHLGHQLHESRATVMGARRVDFTDLYNLVNDPACGDPDVRLIRGAHAALDAAVATAYGWHELLPDLMHGHHETQRFGVRWTVPAQVQREIERRLLRLNLERAAMGGVAVAEGEADEEAEAVDAA